MPIGEQEPEFYELDVEQLKEYLELLTIFSDNPLRGECFISNRFKDYLSGDEGRSSCTFCPGQYIPITAMYGECENYQRHLKTYITVVEKAIIDRTNKRYVKWVV